MKLFLSLYLLCISLHSLAGPPRDEVESLLPSELVKTLNMKDSEAQKTFKKKIFKVEKGEALYLNYFEKKGDVTLGLKDNKVQYLYAEVPEEIQKKGQGLFSKALSWLTPKEKEEIAKKDAKDTSHEKGRYIVLDIPSEAMKLEFYNDENKTLRSVLLWPSGSKAP